MRSRTLVLLGAPALALGLASCATGEDGVSAAAPTVTTTVTVGQPEGQGEPEPAVTETVTVTETVSVPADDAPDTGPESEPEPAPPDGGSVTEGQIAFGETWTWEDGIAVTVSEPEPYETSSSGVGGEAFEDAVRFDVTIENGTDAPLELFAVLASVQSGTSTGDQIFDSANNVSGSPGNTLLAGRSVEFPIAFGVEDPEDLVLQITPGWDHDDAFFVSGD